MTEIKPQDLRLNNWVFDGEQYVQVKQITDGKCYTTYGWSMWDLICGIPLTPEILEKAAVTHLGDYTTGPKLYIEWYDDTQKRVFVNGNYIGVIHMQYLHELQNWYYLANSGTELEITL